MNNENEVEIDVPEENKYAGLELPVAVKSQPLAITKDGTQKSATPQQMRVMEINEALAPAYAKASTLNMTDKEIEALMAPFPDSVVEVRPHDGLIYIPHIHISDRMNRVFKPGQWCMICRRHWLEGNTMYGEYIMLIRGCYVGESVGGHPYQPNNPKVNYSDTLESTAAEALRRIAGKRLSCGWQVWDPSYATSWCEKYRGQQGGKYFKKNIISTAPPPKPMGSVAEPQMSKLDKFIFTTQKAGYPTEQVLQFCIDLAWLLPNQMMSELEDRYLPNTVGDMKSFLSCIANWVAKGDTVQPYDCPIPDPAEKKKVEKVPHGTKPISVPRDEVDEPGDEDAWRQFPMPFGKNSGVMLEDLEKNYLFGLWANYTVETEYKGKPKKPETIEKDQTFRAMLDLAGEHYGFKKKD